jgi:hypothetical protein
MKERRSPLVGLRFTDGEYTVTTADNERLCRLVNAPALPDGTAHPVWCHMATHVGKSVSFPEFAKLVEAPVDAGFLFGGGDFEFIEPIRLDTRYIVRGGIDEVKEHVGRRSGSFDTVTTGLALIDAQDQHTVARCRETWIVPRGQG